MYLVQIDDKKYINLENMDSLYIGSGWLEIEVNGNVHTIQKGYVEDVLDTIKLNNSSRDMVISK